MKNHGDAQEPQNRIASLLLENRGDGTDWGEFADPSDMPWSKKKANRFMLGNLLDYQIPSELAWRNAERLIVNIFGDPDDIWRAITSVPEADWRARRDEYKLHRFPAAHNRLWTIARRICDEYQGDARRIWEGKESSAALETLLEIGAGEQISRMIAGALRDCHQITGVGDVKADTYVRRVLGRSLRGEMTDAETAIRLSRQMHPRDPWQLDAQLWSIGKSWCRATEPLCPACYLAPHCSYALRHSTDAAGALPRESATPLPQETRLTSTLSAAMSPSDFASAAEAIRFPTFRTEEPRKATPKTVLLIVFLLALIGVLVLKLRA